MLWFGFGFELGLDPPRPLNAHTYLDVYCITPAIEGQKIATVLLHYWYRDATTMAIIY